MLLPLLVVLVLASCGGAEERQAAFFARGQTFFDQGNYEKARLEFKNALQIDPKDVQAHYLLGQVLEKLQDWPGAAGQYLAVIKLDNTHAGAKVRLGRLYLLGNVIDKAIEQAEEALKLEPQNPDAYGLRGAVRVKQGDMPGAMQDAEAGLKLDPGHVESIALMSGLHVKNKQADKALALLDEGLVRHPNDTDLQAIKGKILIGQGETDKAALVFEEFLGQEPQNLYAHLGLAKLYTGIKQPDKAEQVLRRAIANNPEDAAAKLALVEFLFVQRDKAQAEKTLLAFIEQAPEVYPLRFGLGRLYEAMDQPHQAKNAYRDIIDEDGVGLQGLSARTKLASLMLRQNDLGEASKLTAEVLEKNAKDKEALALRGDIALARQDPVSAIADFRSLLRDDPDSPRWLQKLAKAHLMNNEPGLARDNLEKAVQANPREVSARSELAQFLANRGEMDRATEQWQEIVKTDPKNAAALAALFKAEAAKRDWPAAHAMARKAKTALPDSALGFYLEGLAYQAEKKFEESLGEFERALKISPDAIEPLSQLVKIYVAQDKVQVAHTRLTQVVERNPKNFMAYNLLGETLLIQKRTDEAETAFRKAIEINPKWATPYIRLAANDLARQDNAGAVEVYKQGLKAMPDDPFLVPGLAAVYEQMGNYDGAIGLYEERLERDPKSEVWANNLAILLADHRKDQASLDRALDLAERLKKSNNPHVLDTVGWVQYARGDNDSAIANLEQALKGAPELTTIHYHLGMAYFKKGDSSAARTHLQKALEPQVAFTGVEEARETLDKLGGSVSRGNTIKTE